MPQVPVGHRPAVSAELLPRHDLGRHVEGGAYRGLELLPVPAALRQAEVDELQGGRVHALAPVLGLVGRLAGWLVGRLAGWLVNWLAGWLAGWLVGWLAVWLVGWSAGVGLASIFQQHLFWTMTMPSWLAPSPLRP